MIAADPPAGSEDGFTLVELLVAMTLLSFLTVLLFGGLRFGTRAWERSEQIHADENAIRTLQAALSDGIAQAYPLALHDGTETRIDFNGGPNALTWMSAAPTVTGAMTRLHVALSEDSSALALSASDERTGAPRSQRVRRLPDVASVEIGYFGKRHGEEVAHWGPRWQAQPRLPTLVRIRVALKDPRTVWPDLVVAPRIAADVGCVLDVLTSDCRGTDVR